MNLFEMESRMKDHKRELEQKAKEAWKVTSDIPVRKRPEKSSFIMSVISKLVRF